MKSVMFDWVSALGSASSANEIGNLFDSAKDSESALNCFESALRQNPYSLGALLGMANVLRAKEMFPQAIEYLKAIVKFEQNNGEVWETLGHCYLMSDNLPEAYQAYQNALYNLQDLKV
jgi:glucose repression mediator protein